MIKKYIIAVLGVSWGLTGIIFLNPNTALNYYACIMFIPLIVTIIFNKTEEKKTGIKKRILSRNFNKGSIIFGFWYPVFFVVLCAAIAVVLRQGTILFQGKAVVWIITELVTVLVGLFSALGEEYGWRGYLLPSLTKSYGKRKAVIITGLVWSLYHIPAVYLLAKLTGIGNPLLVCAIQAGVVFVSNFAFSYCYYLSGNIIPVILYHSIWNALNTAVLGDIYNGKQGIVNGNILLINGEGVLGFILATITVLYFWKKLDHREANTINQVI
jgi:uncharacterized protein